MEPILANPEQTAPRIIIAPLRPALSCSVYQLQQLVGEPGSDAKHEMHPDFRSSPNHHVAGPKPFLQPAIEPLRDSPLLVAHRLMGGQEDNLFSSAMLFR